MAFAVTSFTGLTLVSVQAAEQLGLLAEQQELSIQTALDASAGSRSTGCFMRWSGRGREKPCTVGSRVLPSSVQGTPQLHCSQECCHTRSTASDLTTGQETKHLRRENQCTQQGFILITNTWEVAQRNKPSSLQTRRKGIVTFFFLP